MAAGWDVNRGYRTGATQRLPVRQRHDACDGGERVSDGERWIAARLTLLRARLDAQSSADERRAIEVTEIEVTEIEVLSKERGITLGGLRASRIGRTASRRK